MEKEVRIVPKLDEYYKKLADENKYPFFSYCINEETKKPLTPIQTKKFFLKEGIDIINFHKKRISLTDKHEEVVNTSLILNPTYWKLGKYDVVSIFKRENFKTITGRNIDGNPVIYALKGNYGWSWANEDDIKLLMQKFATICKKINQTFDVLIKAPSDSMLLNKTMLDAVIPIIRHSVLIKDYFYKIHIEDAYDCIDSKRILSDCNGNENEAEIIFKRISRGIKRLDQNGEKPRYISSKNISKEYVKYVRLVTTEYNKYSFEQIVNMIDGKNILIIDDSISTGVTVSQCVQNIVETYNPKSVVILTMFSPLSQKNVNYEPYKGKKYNVNKKT